MNLPVDNTWYNSSKSYYFFFFEFTSLFDVDTNSVFGLLLV